MPDMSQEIEQKKAELTRLQAEQDFFNSLPEAYRLADRLHSLLCHWNHCDECSWYYFDWTKPQLDSNREEYVRKARYLIAAAEKRGINASDMLDIFNEVKSL